MQSKHYEANNEELATSAERERTRHMPHPAVTVTKLIVSALVAVAFGLGALEAAILGVNPVLIGGTLVFGILSLAMLRWIAE